AAKKRDAVPLRTLLLFPGLLVTPGFTGGDTDAGDRSTTGGITGFGVCTQVAHQDDFVDSTCHQASPFGACRRPDFSVGWFVGLKLLGEEFITVILAYLSERAAWKVSQLPLSKGG